MAEALGIASGVIAIVRAAGKAISLSIKLKSLYDELNSAPDTLLRKVEELQFLDEYFHEAETQVSAGPTLDVLSRDVMERKLDRALGLFDLAQQLYCA
ncbi:hypothetical protein CTRI78_v002427 [Colletotrichum trifolii]|uniref:Fungal N-terminal domain-containing protein n=1 Tax=Colletotrichum trifolii TaxID=5466 RepID=A0A4R8RXN9_COLTR|nr:hypothetical protein CTRI78_v002427 [Colletotrichum trifolii]